MNLENKKDVLITVVGRQNFGTHTDKVELTTVGSFSETGTHYVLEYEEAQPPPEQNVQVSVRVNKGMDEVQMERSGEQHSCLVIKQGARSQCSYGTAYGNLVMGLFGKQINLSIHNGEGLFDFLYVIDMNGQVTSRNRVKINFKEN